VPAIEEFLEKLRRGKALDPQSVKDELLHTVACKAAIKAGWDTSRAELSRIVEEVLSGRVKYCPHGRPVSAVLSKKDLEKMFKRIV
jgi:DNA mismatch repair protein MutL